jgi:hypothetical protein
MHRRFMNLPIEGEATPSQRDQRHGGETRNWRIKEATKERASVHSCSLLSYNISQFNAPNSHEVPSGKLQFLLSLTSHSRLQLHPPLLFKLPVSRERALAICCMSLIIQLIRRYFIRRLRT